MGLFKGIIGRMSKAFGRFSKKTAECDLATELSIIINHIPMALYWKDAASVYRGGNSYFGDLTNIPLVELPGKTDADLHSEEAAAAFRKEDKEFVSGERKSMYFTDKLVPKRDGSYMWARTYKIPIYDDEDNIKYIMGLIQDVTKIRHGENALKESESRLRTILNATDDGIVFVDSSGIILDVNGSFLNDFAPNAVDAVGSYLYSLIAPEFFKKIQRRVGSSIETGKPFRFGLSPADTGTNKYFDVFVYPVITDDSAVGIAIYVQDTTEMKQFEEMLLRRTEQLQIAMNEAENANRSKSEFLSRMSHEIRTPLAAVMGMTKIAYTSDDMTKIKDCLSKIDSSSKHLMGVINDVLDMSKIEADKFVLSENVFKLEDMLRDVTNVVSVQADEKRQNFEIILDEKLSDYFDADELRLRQVITNLVSNAIKFTPERGKVWIHINSLSVEEDVSTVEIVVGDNGIGLTTEQQERLFRPFEQADGGIARKFGGTGLGLAICKKIVELMDGEISVESSPGLGSKFIIRIKMKTYNAANAEIARGIQFSDMRALVVDDSSETREYLTRILAKFGIMSESAKDGYDAIEKVNESVRKGDPFNVFFIDWAMPGMDGIATTKKIKSIVDNNAVVIMISITEWEQIEKGALAAGVDRFTPKPFFTSTILSVLNEISGTTVYRGIKTDENGIPDLTGSKILLVEDTEINREIAEALLAPTNVEIVFAFNGKEAVDKYNAAKESFDLILMDIHMPEMDGYTATKIIRENNDEKSLSIPIVAMTADAFKEDIDKCKAVGMNDHIAKPINENEMFKKISTYVTLYNNSNYKDNNHSKQGREDLEVDEKYIDEKDALTRLGGSKKLYIKLLKSFLNDKINDSLKESMAAGDVEKAELAAHSLKGMAANLSLKVLYGEATKLNTLLKDKKMDMDALQSFETAMEQTICEVEAFLAVVEQEQ